MRAPRVMAPMALLLGAACSEVWGFQQGELDELVGAGGGAAVAGAGGGAGAGADGAGGTTGVAGAPSDGGGTGAAGGSAGGGGAVATGGSGGSPPPPECAPGDTRDVGDCAKCGDLIEHCDANGFWAPSTCEGQGVCEVGERSQSSCEACGEKVCTASCAWSACQPDVGKECLWEEGTNWRYCGGDQHHWQYCLSSCVWSTACEYCEPYC